MNLSKQIAKNFREVYFGGNWTSSYLQQHVLDIDWQQATTKYTSFNTIAALVYHIGYYVSAVSNVMQGNSLDAHDKYSFDHPPIHSSEDWNNLLDKTWNNAEQFARLIEDLPESKIWEPFADGKYGNYYRNLVGVIEHAHYHLGQIVLIKKFFSETSSPPELRSNV